MVLFEASACVDTTLAILKQGKLSREVALRLGNNIRSSLLYLGLILFVLGVGLYLFGLSYTIILCPSGTNWCGGGGIYLYARVSGIVLMVIGTAMMIGSRFVKTIKCS